MPTPDIVIVDEKVLSVLTASTLVEPALLSDPAYFASSAGEEQKVQEAIDYGQAVADAVAGGDGAITRLRDAGVPPKHLCEAAEAAIQSAENAMLRIAAGDPVDYALATLRNHKRHPGRSIAAVLSQAARDLVVGRKASLGLEWDSEHTVTDEDGNKLRHPVIRHHGRTPPTDDTASVCRNG